jgi:hypothetical protein
LRGLKIVPAATGATVEARRPRVEASPPPLPRTRESKNSGVVLRRKEAQYGKKGEARRQDAPVEDGSVERLGPVTKEIEADVRPERVGGGEAEEGGGHDA